LYVCFENLYSYYIACIDRSF